MHAGIVFRRGAQVCCYGSEEKKMTANCHHMPETQHSSGQADSSSFFRFHWYQTAQS